MLGGIQWWLNSIIYVFLRNEGILLITVLRAERHQSGRKIMTYFLTWSSILDFSILEGEKIFFQCMEGRITSFLIDLLLLHNANIF